MMSQSRPQNHLYGNNLNIYIFGALEDLNCKYQILCRLGLAMAILSVIHTSARFSMQTAIVMYKRSLISNQWCSCHGCGSTAGVSWYPPSWNLRAVDFRARDDMPLARTPVMIHIHPRIHGMHMIIGTILKMQILWQRSLYMSANQTYDGAQVGWSDMLGRIGHSIIDICTKSKHTFKILQQSPDEADEIENFNQRVTVPAVEVNCCGNPSPLLQQHQKPWCERMIH